MLFLIVPGDALSENRYAWTGQLRKDKFTMETPTLKPEQATFLLNGALPRLKIEHDTTKRVIQAVPLDKGDYRPDAVSKSALELAWHIVAAEQRFLSGICDGSFDFTPINRPDSVKNSADIAEWFD